uniref:Swt1-like HEPN domain-containing protein n=1 Tax=Eubacterium cellulosolvens (strain ATCC 43171 / JCM 9499 / 6) TaxID=633697 RepID=I5AXJ2_EUBC6
MQENYEFVQRGFRILVTSMSGYIGQELNKTYKKDWWKEVLIALSDQRDLPFSGEYGDLVDSLDIANCIRLLDRKWNEVFRDILPLNCRTWAKELMGVRNIVSHIGQQDLEQLMAERALDTMALLCKEIDPEGAEDIREIYQEVRGKADGRYKPTPVVYTGLAQPESESKRGELTEGSLLQMVGTDVVEKTTMTRKVTYGGKTVVYPVYRVRLDMLYYNDQNDRIATWITRYESENGKGELSDLNVEIRNRIIENFIYESNPDSIQKTQKNIALFGQREPGVTLADGRIVDGNRRFTCLRRIQRDSAEPIYFETVIMDMDIREDKKQIKLLELSIQHGEEKKVDYDLIDYSVGTYRDIVQTRLLTVEEYASRTNESVADVKKRIEIVEVISEFLAYIKLPEQYHVAREYQLFALFQEMISPLKKLDEGEKEKLKKIAFNNVVMKAIPDQRKFIRDIKGLIKNGTYISYFEDQERWASMIHERIASADIRSKEDIDKFASENKDIADELQASMERALLRSRSQLLKNKPAENVSKSIMLMMEVDSRLFNKMDADEKENLMAELDEMSRIVDNFRRALAR